MHFPIIAIESLETDKADFIKDLPYEERTLESNTDYYGDMYDPKNRLKVIRSKWLKSLLKGYATVNARNQTITFLDAETIRKNFKRYLEKTTEELHRKATKGKLSGYDLLNAGNRYNNFSTMFYWDYGQTSFDFIEDAEYHAGKTVRIGNIFDAHY